MKLKFLTSVALALLIMLSVNLNSTAKDQPNTKVAKKTTALVKSDQQVPIIQCVVQNTVAENNGLPIPRDAAALSIKDPMLCATDAAPNVSPGYTTVIQTNYGASPGNPTLPDVANTSPRSGNNTVAAANSPGSAGIVMNTGQPNTSNDVNKIDKEEDVAVNNYG
jgi:hypothetical protein